MIETLNDLFKFFKKNKKWWLVPIVVMLLLFGILIIYSQGTAVAPFVYTLF